MWTCPERAMVEEPNEQASSLQTHTHTSYTHFPSVTLLSQQSAPEGANTEPYIRTANPNSGLVISNETHMHTV